jgi:hypothetical protein
MTLLAQTVNPESNLMAGLEAKGEAVGACDVLPLWNWCKYLYNYPIVRFCFEAAVVYLRFKVARPPWRACRFVSPAAAD